MSRIELSGGLSSFWQGLDLDQAVTGWGGLDWATGFEQAKLMFAGAREENASLVIESGDDVARKWSLTLGFDAAHQLDSVSLSFAGSSEAADFAAISRGFISRLGVPARSTSTSQTWQRDGNDFTLSKAPGGGVVLSRTV